MTDTKNKNNLNSPALRFPEFTEPWQKMKLSSIANIVGRIGFRGYTTNDIVKKGEGALALSPTNIENNTLTYDKENTYVSFSKYEESPEIQLTEGDIVFVKTGSTVGKVAFVSNLNTKTTINPQLVILKELKVDSYLLSVILSTNLFQNNIKRITVGGAVPTLSQNAMGQIFVSIPSKEEQQKIAELLRLIDERIATQRRLIDKLETLIKGVREHLFKKMFGDMVCLSNIAEIYQPQTISSTELLDNGYPVYGANGIIGYYDSYNHETEQICITCRGNTCGTVNYTIAKSWITGNAMVVNIDNHSDIVCKRFLFHYLSEYKFKSIISGSGQPQIVRSPLQKLKVILPSLNKQIQIANFLDTLLHKTDLESFELDLLQKQRLHLLQQMFI